MMADLLKRAGLPDGVFNVVQGDKEAVDALLVAPGREGGELCGFHADCQLHLRDRREATASACRPWAAPRTTWW
jgi:hypothetical protein